MYHLRKLKSLLLLLLVAVSARAQISNGKVYNIVSVEYSKSLAITSGEYITVVPTNESGSEQLWYVEGNETDGYTLRSLCSGYYLRSSNGQSSKWTMVSETDDNCKLKCHAVGSNYTFRATNTTDDWHSMHLATSQGSHIVGWTSSASATQWTINEVSVTPEQLTALLNKANEVTGAVNNVDSYQSALTTLFSDKACTTLNSEYASMDETTLKNQEAYNNLPTTLQNMVLKVRYNSWAEDNYDDLKSDWDADYAKKYRVQFYEPYNEPECAASALGIHAHTNLNNPTGIFANVQDILYVMVDGEIADGSALYLASYKDHGKLGGFREGVQLKQGLNIIPSFEAGTNYCINYVVHTFDTSKGKGNKAKARKLSDYDDLKIHIEGGHINGYWNKMGDYNQTGSDVLYDPDTHTDWNYIAERATQTDVTILGEYITLQFPLHSAIDNEGHSNNGMSYYLSRDGIDIKDVIDEWDKVMLWERLVMGLLDKETTEAEAKKSPYSEKDYVFDYIGDDTDGFESGYGDYYNVHGLSYGTPHGYMYGSWDHCGYHYNTMGAIMNTMINDAGSHWGPAHEIGHQHQTLLNLNGLTEVTNNLFSNIVLWYVGKTTSRVNGSALEPIMEVFSAEGTDFFSTNANVFITTQMYYKLFLYYHVLGHNPKFYPKLFELLRQDPMTGGYYQQGSTTILHFYKKCCEAAGEDLTEFFRAYSFFSVMTDRLVGDYGNSVYNQTQKDIDEAIAEVKAMAAEKGWEQNIAVLFINDDTGEKILSHRDDVEYLAPYESADSELGCYASYVNTTEPNYTYTITGNTVTMTGEGGTGIAIFNEKGELIGFSDNKTFEVSDECAIAIASGQAEVVAMKADNTTVEAVDIMDTDDTQAKHALLGELLDAAKTIVELSDETNTKLGYYRKEALTDLQSAYTKAKTVYDNRTVASYDAVYDALNDSYSEMLHNDYVRIGLVEGNTYRLTNKAYPERLMTVNSASNVMSGLAEYNDSTDLQLWYFESSDTEGRYYLKNKGTSKYPGNVSTGAVLSANQEKGGAHAYELRDMGNGIWALVGATGLHCSASQSYNIVGWGTDAPATQWYITAVDKNDDAEALYNLQAQIAKTEALIDEVGYATQVQLQATDSLAPFHLYCNALFKALNNDDTSPNTAKLLDGNPATHIHTDYRTNEGDYKADDDLDHYLRVDLGSGNAVSEFSFTYTTRNAGGTQSHPKTIKVEGSNNLITFEEIVTLPRTGEAALPGANSNNSGTGKYTSPTITNGNAYRYLRFMVTETQGNNVKSYGNHPYFYMAEFDLELDNIVKVDDKYSSEITVDELTEAFSSLLSAKEIVENANSDQYAAAYTALEEYYNALLADKNRVETSNFTALKDELSALIANTTTLIGECGKVTVVPGTFDGKAPLQTTEADAAFYLWTNAQHATEGHISGLVDGKYGSSYTASEYYFHTDYSGANSTDGLDHHITVNLGEGNAVSKFKFQYWNRTNTDGNYIAEMKIYGKKGNGDYILITTLNDMPKSAGTTYESSVITCAEEYDYLRFMVTKNSSNNSRGGHPIFHMAEFELNIIGAFESYTAELNHETAGDAGIDLLVETFKKNAEAQGVYDYATTENQLEVAIIKLQSQYDKLLAAQQSSDKDALRELVALTTTLIDECGTLTYVPSTASVALQATNSTAGLYLSCSNLFYDIIDNPGDSDTNCADLLDNNTSTYIHTNYNAAQSTYPHYLQVAFGANEIPLQFKFSYTTRHNGPNQVPKHIIVKGSNDGVNFKDVLCEYDWEDGNSPLPTTQNTSWTAPEYLTGGYAYLRFYVTKSPASVEGATNTTTPFFAMSEFSMSYTGYAIKWKDAQHGTATNEHLIAAYEARNAANELLATTTTKDDLQTATAALQEKYTELYNAKNGIQNINFTISSNVAGGGVVYNNHEYTETVTAPETLNAGELTAIPLATYTDGVITMNGTTITVTYNKVYRVQVVGVEPANGGVKLGETTYAGGDTFEMLESEFNIEDFNVIDLQGYEEYKTFDGTTITVTYKKIYNVVVEGIDAANGGVTLNGTTSYAGGATFEMLESDFDVDRFTAIDLDGYREYKSFDGSIITVIYNKIYTVQVTGGRGNGGVTYNSTTYTNGKTFDVLESLFDEDELEADVPAGYELKGEIAVDQNGIISVAFSAIPFVEVGKYYTLACKATDHNTYIRDNVTVINGQSAEGSLFQFEAADDDNGYYIKSWVTDKYLNHANGAVYASEQKATIWTMEKPSHTSGVYTLTVGNNLYLNNVAGDCTDGSCANLQSKEHPGGTGSGNACSLWTITEGTPLDMTELLNLINATNSLIASCYQNGNVEGELLYFNSAYVNADVMAATKTAVTNAQAKYANGRATTVGEYNTVLTALQAANTTLTSNISLAETEASDRLASREALREKIEALGDVIDLCGVVEWGRYPTGRVAVSLTEANLSTNAQEKSEGPIANLLKDDDSFFHSSWQGSAGAAHYLQVDLGEGKSLQEFVFGYTTRNNGPHPYIIVVSGSNDKDGSFEEIKVFNLASGLPNAGSTSWEASAPIVSSQPYRYLRFTVTKSSNLRSFGEYCFAMSKFELKTIAYSENEDYYVEYLNPNGSVTEEQLLDAYLTMIAAGDLDNEYTSKSDLDAKIDELQSLCDELSSALNDLQLPVVLTTDMESPVLYTIKSKRGDTKLLQYDPAEGHMFSIADASSDNAKQLFYFTVGDTRTQVYVHPFAAGEQVLAADNTENGAAKVFAREKGAALYDQWVFVKREQEYNLQPVGASTYFSNFNGGTAKMGFYASSPDSDAGSLFSFASASIEGSASYHSLKIYKEELAKVASSEIVGGSNPGYYPENEANAYNAAYAIATNLLSDITSTYADYFAAYKALKAANEALELIMPSADKFYRFVSVVKGDGSNAFVYAAPADNKMYWATDKGASDATAIWSIAPSETEGMYNVTNLHTGSSINGFINYNPSPLSETEGNVSIVSLSVNGQVGIKCNGSMMHAQGGGSVVHWDTGADDGSAWRIVEVEDMSLVKFAVSISQYEHAGLYLNYPVTIPDGVKAYYLDGTKITIDNGVGSLNLTKIEEDVIPAETAVILYAPQDNYEFVYADEPNYKYEDNLFTGSTYQTFREAQTNHNYYVFGQRGGEIGLYKNAVKYSEDATEVGEEDGTHYKMSANKILFDWDGSTHQVSSFRFRMGGQTTGMEDEVVEDNVIIYDLYGRRILEVVTSGLYIVNGEKRYIRVK